MHLEATRGLTMTDEDVEPVKDRRGCLSRGHLSGDRLSQMPLMQHIHAKLIVRCRTAGVVFAVQNGHIK